MEESVPTTRFLFLLYLTGYEPRLLEGLPIVQFGVVTTVYTRREYAEVKHPLRFPLMGGSTTSTRPGERRRRPLLLSSWTVRLIDNSVPGMLYRQLYIISLQQTAAGQSFFSRSVCPVGTLNKRNTYVHRPEQQQRGQSR